jgi:hypothetical protein
MLRSKTLVLLALAALHAGPAGADAILRSDAMFATTIAELWIEDERVYVELEIGQADLAAFAPLLPDELRPASDLPREAQLEAFFREQLVVATPTGPLPGRLLSVEPRFRVRRDTVSGEPLPDDPENPPERVVFARLEYPFAARPDTLELRGPGGATQAGVGFVTYHRGIAVNDFRYLGPQYVLALDWEDPWYSSFKSASLRRAYFAPMSGFLYVESFEVRKEIIARPRDLQHWVDLGLEGRERIPVALQAELKRRVGAFLREHHRVHIDDKKVDGDLARIDFLERTLRASRMIDPPRELDVDSAILGVTFVYPVDGLPERVTLDWDLWNERIQQIPAASVDQAGALPTLLDPEYPLLEWRNFLKSPDLPTLKLLERPPSALIRATRPLRWVLAVGALLALAGWAVRRSPGFARLSVTIAALAALAFWIARDAALTDARARHVVGGLLHNVYRAFDYRDEERIYDVLSSSVEGELLEQIYLETRRSLELAGQGGARARVREVELVEIETGPRSGGGFRALTVWNVTGSVGHWGHLHPRRNRYRAEVEVAADAGRWKLVGLEVLDEQRL